MHDLVATPTLVVDNFPCVVIMFISCSLFAGVSVIYVIFTSLCVDRVSCSSASDSESSCFHDRKFNWCHQFNSKTYLGSNWITFSGWLL